MRHVTGKMISYEALREIIEAWIVQMAHKNIAQTSTRLAKKKKGGKAQEKNKIKKKTWTP